jgi:predicted alpha/beta hydrolase
MQHDVKIGRTFAGLLTGQRAIAAIDSFFDDIGCAYGGVTRGTFAGRRRRAHRKLALSTLGRGWHRTLSWPGHPCAIAFAAAACTGMTSARAHLRVIAEDGWPLAVERHAAGRTPRAVVVAGHAMMADRRSLDRPPGRGLASTLAGRGFEVWCFDARGHGASGPAADVGGAWRYDDLVQRDLPAVVAAARAARPDLPLAVLGHSLFAHGALAWLGPRAPAAPSPVDALVLLAGNVWLRRLDPDPARWAVKRALMEGLAGMAQRVGHVPARRLKFGTDAESFAYIRQFRDWVRTDRWTSADGRIDYLAAGASLRLPVLAVAGAGDHLLCHPACSERFVAAALPACGVDHRVVSWGRYRPGHMALATDPRSAPLWHDVAEWLAMTL